MITVVVPTYNREECLYQMLQSLNKQRYKDFEVLVIDQSHSVSDTKISNILTACRNIHYFQINRQGRSLAKNFGIEMAKGDVILFCDDDIIADEQFLAEHARIHRELPEVGAASCHLIEPHEREVVSKMPLKITVYGRFVNKPNAIYEGYVTSLNGGNMSFKKQALEKVGYFEENFKGTSMLEEPDIAFRILMTGYKIYFSSRTKVRHFPQHNGNIGSKNEKRFDWEKDFYFNQFFFVLRNKRTRYFLFVFAYLLYRTVFIAIKNKMVFFPFLVLPFSAFKRARANWKQKQSEYRNEWYTSKHAKIEILKSISTQNAFA
jgi:glycosyltransferase involved in cell wall biosynthesis